MSIIFARAAELHQEMTNAYELSVQGQYDQALAATNGFLVNRRGTVKRIDSISLFRGSERNAYLYASEELIQFWEQCPRISKAQYERVWADSLGVK